jgi:uncharacterized protein YegJ (DUF2314 family)
VNEGGPPTGFACGTTARQPRGKRRPAIGSARVALLLAAFVAACSSEKSVIMVPDDDPEMDAAIHQARASVGTFIARLQSPQKGDEYFSVKTPIREGDHVEHFWLDALRHENGVFIGKLGNDPEIVKGHEYGESVTVAATGISDWMYVQSGVLVGGHTIRLLRKRMKPEDRARLDAEMKFRIE